MFKNKNWDSQNPTNPSAPLDLKCELCGHTYGAHGRDFGCPNALQTQIGGGHYKDLVIQPIEYIHKNKIGFCEGSVIKYVTRWRDKGGVQDLKKARHFLDLLIELEGGQ